MATVAYTPLIYIHSFPDVMLESYHILPYSPIFFIIYLVITLYIVANLVSLCIKYTKWEIIQISVTNIMVPFATQILAVIYNSFSVEAKKKFKKLYLHKRYPSLSTVNQLMLLV